MLPRPSWNEFTRPRSLAVDTNVAIGMRDGTILYADVFRPAGGGRFPVLLSRIPYGKHRPQYHSMYLDPVRAVARGYAVVIQDVRGRHTSEGEFYPFRDEAHDGFDTVEWCAGQPWSDGNVGMFGISYHGATQWLAAVAAPSQLGGDRSGCHVRQLLRQLALPGRGLQPRVRKRLAGRSSGP